jgi:hypothetical protein
VAVASIGGQDMPMLRQYSSASWNLGERDLILPQIEENEPISDKKLFSLS